MEQIAKMTDELKSIGERQDKMVTETADYEKTRTESGGKLTLAQRNGVREAGRVESGLKDEVTELVDRIGDGAPVFGLTLKKAGESMDDAATRLAAGKTDDPTLRAEKLAASRFRQLIDSLKPDKGKGGAGGGGGGGGGPKGGGDGIPATAQIKILKIAPGRTQRADRLVRRDQAPASGTHSRANRRTRPAPRGSRQPGRPRPRHDPAQKRRRGGIRS